MAFHRATSGAYNTAIGDSAGQYVTTGGYNTLIGYQAGNNCSTGEYNTCLGIGAGASLSTGSRNLFVGYNINPSNGSDIMMIGSGNVTHNGNFTNHGFMGPGNSSGGYGGMYQGNNSSSWSTTSDRRIKKNIVDNNIGLAEINQLRVRNFEYRTEDEIEDKNIADRAVPNKGVQVGVIAQEVMDIIPAVVNTHEETGIMSVNPDNLTWYLVNAVKELSAKNEALEARLAALES